MAPLNGPRTKPYVFAERYFIRLNEKNQKSKFMQRGNILNSMDNRTFNRVSTKLTTNVIICFIIYLSFQLNESLFWPLLLTVLALYDLFRASKIVSLPGLIFYIIYLICASVLAVLYFVYLLNISPLTLTEARYYYFQDAYILESLLIASIFFSFSAKLVYHTYIRSDILKDVNPKFRYTLYILTITFCLITSLVINGADGTIVEGGYGVGYKIERWGGWPLLFTISTAILVLLAIKMEKKFIVIVFFLALSVLYWLFAGNRSEILALFLIIIFLFTTRNSHFQLQITIQRLLLFGSLAVLIIIGFDYIGYARVHGLSSLNYAFSPLSGNDRISISTIGSSAWTIIASVGVVDQKGHEFGATYLAYIANSIPSFIPVPWERISDIAYYTSDAGTIGGSFMPNEAYINFGIPGVILFSWIFFSIINLVLKQSRFSSLQSIFYLSLAIYSQRYLLYGFTYLWKLILIMLILNILVKFISNKNVVIRF